MYLTTEPSMSKASIGRKRSRGRTPLKGRRGSGGSNPNLTLTNQNQASPEKEELIYEEGDLWKPAIKKEQEVVEEKEQEVDLKPGAELKHPSDLTKMPNFKLLDEREHFQELT